MDANNKISQDGHGKHRPDLLIEGTSFDWPHQFITGVQIKELAGIATDANLYLAVDEPWDDELIQNETSVDLGRPEIESFFIKKRLKFTINKEEFESDRQYITGKRIKKLGNIDSDDELYLDNNEPSKDQLITDETKVNLARSGTEHFYTKEKNKEYTIIVAGTPHKWDKKRISFREVIVLAFGEYIDLPTMVYTVAYEDGPKQNPEGSMTKNSVVFVKDKMIFHATATDKS